MEEAKLTGKYSISIQFLTHHCLKDKNLPYMESFSLKTSCHTLELCRTKGDEKAGKRWGDALLFPCSRSSDICQQLHRWEEGNVSWTLPK